MDSLHSNVHVSVRLTHGPCLQWGEEISFLEANKKKVQITDKFLTVKEGAEEFIVGTTADCVVRRTVKRRPRDPVFFNSIREHPEDCCQITRRENPENQKSNRCESVYVLGILIFFLQSTGNQPSLVDCTPEISRAGHIRVHHWMHWLCSRNDPGAFA